MKKNLSAAAVLFLSAVMYSQVGINNTDPKATLDITAKTTDGSKAEGFIAPRLTGDQIKSADAKYDSDRKGAIVYATAGVATSSAKTANITGEGYYYFDGTLWQKMALPNSATNGLTASSGNVKLGGNLTEATTVSNITSTNKLSFTSATNAGADAVIAVGTPTGTSGGIIFGNPNHGVKRGFPVTGTGNDVGLFTTAADVYLSSNGASTGQFVLKNSGNVGIGTDSPTAKLEVNNGTTAGAIKIVDGTQGAGKVLVSDANGVGTWQVNTGNQSSLHEVKEATATDTTLTPNANNSIPGIGQYSCQNTGRYELITHTFFKVDGSSAADQRSFYIEVIKNGSVIKEEEVYFYAAGGGWLTAHIPLVVSANVSDTLEIKIKPSIGGTFLIESGTANRNKLDVFYLGL